MTDEERINVVKYRMKNAMNTLSEVLDHIQRGYYNTAVNRMYCACFYAATALLIAYQIEAKSHFGVRQMLGKYFVSPGLLSIEKGKFYTLIFSKRSAGDYEDFINYTQESVQALYPQTEDFVKEIKLMVDMWLSKH